MRGIAGPPALALPRLGNVLPTAAPAVRRARPRPPSAACTSGRLENASVFAGRGLLEPGAGVRLSAAHFQEEKPELIRCFY